MSMTDWNVYEQAALKEIQQQERFEGRFTLGVLIGLSTMAGLCFAIIGYMVRWIEKMLSM